MSTIVTTLPDFTGLRDSLVRIARKPAVELAVAAAIFFVLGVAVAIQF